MSGKEESTIEKAFDALDAAIEHIFERINNIEDILSELVERVEE